MDTPKVRKIFEVYIHNNKYNVYDIEGKEHEGYNDVPKTWWLYYSRYDKVDGTPPDPDDKAFRPFCTGINRRVWEIKIKQSNTSKEKWGDTHFSNHTYTEMWCNNKLVYAFNTGGIDSGLAFAMAKVQYMMVVLSEHPYNFFEPEQENGRKICWYGLPATVRVKSDTWEITIIPDYTAGMSKEEWWRELDRRESKVTKFSDDDKEMDEMYKQESRDEGYINWGDAFEDGNIYWFRK